MLSPDKPGSSAKEQGRHSRKRRRHQQGKDELLRQAFRYNFHYSYHYFIISFTNREKTNFSTKPSDIFMLLEM